MTSGARSTDIMSVRFLTIASLLFCSVMSYESFFGSCPSAPAMKTFDMEKFEGIWYVVESFDDYRWCVTWNITKGSTDYGTWTLTESEESGVVYDIGLQHSHFYKADITQTNASNPAQMRIKWRLSIATSDFTIHTTDYEDYAGVFECQNVGLFHRQNGVVLSRKPGLHGAKRQLARVRTSHIKVEYYKPVRQYGCQIRPITD